ncbi:hypothetical protein PEDI_39510 [Persicobacter diffluens]|uniref:Uncharacterized protein n=1 Tax=Persicobacter diffluens TaxID=981 RepID=A0AAN5ALM5_9BACT|nr:hypothetical protein PEDI_39510 [Persicobacter diffluens]
MNNPAQEENSSHTGPQKNLKVKLKDRFTPILAHLTRSAHRRTKDKKEYYPILFHFINYFNNIS